MGDLVTAQKMVGDAAKKAGFKIGPVYHGTDADFTEFTKGENRMAMRAEVGFWFTTEREDCVRFGARTIPAYLSIKKAKHTTERNLDFDAVARPASEIVAGLKAAGVDGYRIAAIAECKPLDQPAQAEQWVAFTPEQIKSAEPACYDDNGQLIALSMRFLPGTDIRGGCIPELSGRSMSTQEGRGHEQLRR